MPDFRDDEFDDDWPAPGGAEEVRVVGEPGEQPPPGPPQQRPAGRFPLPGESPGGGGGEPRRRRRGREGRDTSAELPHWTEPATGQVPRVLGGNNPDEDLESWGQVTGQGPRFRSGDADWNEGDWAEGELFKDETMGLGALAEHPDDRGGYEEYAPPRRGRGGRPPRAPVQEQQATGAGMLEGAAYEDPYPGEYDEHPDHAAPADLGPRMITGVIVGVVALVALLAGRVPGLLLATVIVGVCAFEFYAALQRAGYQPATLLGLLGSALAVPLAYEAGERGILIAAVIVGSFTLFWYLFGVVHARPIVNAALTLLPFAWIGVFGAFAGLMLSVPEVGNKMLLGVVICAVGSDVIGYFVGRSIGRTPLMPHVSPNKTIEGFIAGAITAVVLGAVVGGVLEPWKDKGVGAGLMLGILVAITAPLGDLVESMIKRDLGVKDLGGVLPGHGGFLDRFDAMLFALPAAYYWAIHLFT